jgi:hypothetical protein
LTEFSILILFNAHFEYLGLFYYVHVHFFLTVPSESYLRNNIRYSWEARYINGILEKKIS